MPDADLFRVPAGPGEIHVERYGFGGPAIVLLHGFVTSSFLWRHVGPRIARYQQTAFALDLLGYGESDRPFAADFGIRAQAEYVDTALTALRLPKVTLVGVDVGAVVALQLAWERPDRVERLVLISPTAVDDLPGDDIRELQRDSATYALTMGRQLLAAWPLFEAFLTGTVARREHMPPRLVGRYLAPYLGRDGINHLLTLARALEGDDVDYVPGEIRQPTQVVRGIADTRCDRGHALALSRALGNAQFVELDGVGRLIPEEDAVTLSRLLATTEAGAVVRAST